MVSNPAEIRLNDLPDPATVLETRDRVLALAFVRRKEARGAVQEIARESGVDDRTVYRAVKRQIEWAREEVAKETKAPESPGA